MFFDCYSETLPEDIRDVLRLAHSVEMYSWHVVLEKIPALHGTPFRTYGINCLLISFCRLYLTGEFYRYIQ